MADLEAEKALAAGRAVDELRDGMLVGLGTGSTTAYAIREIGTRVATGLRVSVVATSSATDALARQVGLNPLDFKNVSRLDLTIDGADEITLDLKAIKGGGGALMREKVLAAASDRVIAIVDSSKPVNVLGRFELPLEVLPFAQAWVTRAVAELGVSAELRTRDGTPVLTDQNNLILDVPFELIPDPKDLAARLDRIPGLLEHGLFVDEIDTVIIGRDGEVHVIQRR